MGIQVSGRWVCASRDGTEIVIGPGDAFDVPAGHDSWVVGDEPSVTIDFQGSDYAARRCRRPDPDHDPVHRHRGIHRPRRTAWRRALEAAPAYAPGGRSTSCSRISRRRWSTRPATASLRGSTAPPMPCAAREPSWSPPAVRRSRSGSASTPPRWSSWTTTSAAWACTWPRGSWLRPREGQILVSATTRELAAGTALTFTEKGSFELKGISGARTLFALDRRRARRPPEAPPGAGAGCCRRSSR